MELNRQEAQWLASKLHIAMNHKNINNFTAQEIAEEIINIHRLSYGKLANKQYQPGGKKYGKHINKEILTGEIFRLWDIIKGPAVFKGRFENFDEHLKIKVTINKTPKNETQETMHAQSDFSDYELACALYLKEFGTEYIPKSETKKRSFRASEMFAGAPLKKRKKISIAQKIRNAEKETEELLKVLHFYTK